MLRKHHHTLAQGAVGTQFAQLGPDGPFGNVKMRRQIGGQNVGRQVRMMLHVSVRLGVIIVQLAARARKEQRGAAVRNRPICSGRYRRA